MVEDVRRPRPLKDIAPDAGAPTPSRIIDQAERLWWQGATDEAIALLDPIRQAPEFWPKGAVTLAFVLRQRGAAEKAQALAAEVLLRFPDDLAAWEILLYAELERSDRPELDPRFVKALRNRGQVMRKGIRLPAVLSLIRFCPDDWRDIAGSLLSGGVLGDDDMAVLAACTGFVHKVRTTRPPVAPGGFTWSFAVLGSALACHVVGGHCRLDLSWFRGAGIAQGWTPQVLCQLALALVAELGSDTYRDDAGCTSTAEIAEADFPATLVEILLVANLLALTGADADVRHAQRPMRLDPGTLLVRAGRVELWALTTWALDRQAALQAATAVAGRALGLSSDPEAFEDTSYWWPRLDAEANATYLWTNAGWYADHETAAAAFDDWASRYVAALTSADLLVECAEDLKRLATLCPALRYRPLHDWDAARFLQFLDGRRVVFATPYAREVQAHWDSGALQSLWRDAGLGLRLGGLRTVEAPMSVWPFRPDRNWSTSFDHLRADCARAIDETGADLFLASCGCYGLPITHAMHQGFRGLTAVYNGHMMNGVFGILTNDLRGRDLHRTAHDSPHWQVVNLDSRFPGIARIDDGRYASDDLAPAQGRIP